MFSPTRQEIDSYCTNNQLTTFRLKVPSTNKTYQKWYPVRKLEPACSFCMTEWRARRLVHYLLFLPLLNFGSQIFTTGYCSLTPVWGHPRCYATNNDHKKYRRKFYACNRTSYLNLLFPRYRRRNSIREEGQIWGRTTQSSRLMLFRSLPPVHRLSSGILGLSRS